ncbi:hypothetical protein B0H11DRAFT_699715 [Mycena galericulata]|nr:hypothetical protein B0H11DRAFT_699715 [Mycena galericulata]
MYTVSRGTRAVFSRGQRREAKTSPSSAVAAYFSLPPLTCESRSGDAHAPHPRGVAASRERLSLSTGVAYHVLPPPHHSHLRHHPLALAPCPVVPLLPSTSGVSSIVQCCCVALRRLSLLRLPSPRVSTGYLRSRIHASLLSHASSTDYLFGSICHRPLALPCRSDNTRILHPGAPSTALCISADARFPVPLPASAPISAPVSAVAPPAALCVSPSACSPIQTSAPRVASRPARRSSPRAFAAPCGAGN